LWGSDPLRNLATGAEAIERSGGSETASGEPREQPGDEHSADDGSDRVDDDERQGRSGVPEQQVSDGHREASAGSREDRTARAPVGVKEGGEDDLGAHSLSDAADESQDAPLVTDKRRDRRRDDFTVNGGTGLADDEGREHTGEEPEAAPDRLQSWQQRRERCHGGRRCDVPDDEDQSARNTDDAGHDDVDDAPLKTRSECRRAGSGRGWCCCGHFRAFH